MRMEVIPSAVPPQVAVELRANVIQLVKERYQFVIEVLIQKSRQAKREQIKKLIRVMHIPLNLIDAAALHALGFAPLRNEVA